MYPASDPHIACFCNRFPKRPFSLFIEVLLIWFESLQSRTAIGTFGHSDLNSDNKPSFLWPSLVSPPVSLVSLPRHTGVRGSHLSMMGCFPTFHPSSCICDLWSCLCYVSCFSPKFGLQFPQRISLPQQFSGPQELLDAHEVTHTLRREVVALQIRGAPSPGICLPATLFLSLASKRPNKALSPSTSITPMGLTYALDCFFSVIRQSHCLPECPRSPSNYVMTRYFDILLQQITEAYIYFYRKANPPPFITPLLSLSPFISPSDKKKTSYLENPPPPNHQITTSPNRDPFSIRFFL